MIVCPNCKKELDDGNAYCVACGTKLAPPQPAQEPAPAAEESATAETPAVVEAPAVEEATSQQAPEKAPFQFPKKYITFGAVAAAAILAVILLISLLGGGEPNYAMFIKDGEMFFADMPGGKPWQVTDNMIDSDDLEDEDIAEEASGLGSAIHLTKDGKTLFYFDKVSEGDNGLNLYYRSATNPKKEAVKLDSDVTLYSVSEDGKTVTYLKGGEDANLYQHDLENKEKIDGEVRMFYVTKDGKKILYLTKENDLYLKNAGKDAEKLDSEITSVSYVSEDLKTVYYLKDGSLYKKNGTDDKVKIASDVDSVYRVYDSGEVYYSKAGKTETKLTSYVDDDMKESDAAMTEPTAPEYVYYSDYDNYDEYLAAREKYDEDYEKYRQARAAYSEKEDRDELRQDLEEEVLSGESKTLCYYNGKEEKVLSEDMSDWERISNKDATPVIIYTSYKKSSVEKVKLSEMDSISQLKEAVEEALFSKKELYFAVKDAAFVQDLDDAENFTFDADAKNLYYIADLSEESEHGDIYKVSISDNKFGTPEVYDSDVYSYSLSLYDDNLLYYKDVKENKGDLYMNKEMVDYDVSGSNVLVDEKTVYYMTDWNSEKNEGTLKVYKKGKAQKIADDVFDYIVTPEGQILYLYDYSLEHFSGELYLYKNGKAEKIEDDVTALLPVVDSTYKGIYSF